MNRRTFLSHLSGIFGAQAVPEYPSPLTDTRLPKTPEIDYAHRLTAPVRSNVCILFFGHIGAYCFQRIMQDIRLAYPFSHVRLTMSSGEAGFILRDSRTFDTLMVVGGLTRGLDGYSFHPLIHWKQFEGQIRLGLVVTPPRAQLSDRDLNDITRLEREVHGLNVYEDANALWTDMDDLPYQEPPNIITRVYDQTYRFLVGTELALRSQI